MSMHWDDPATEAIACEHGLTAAEWERVLQHLARTPNITEVGIFAAMWSEHCSYKSSRLHLRKFPTRGPRVIQGPGENAGVVDIGQGWVAIFKMESHNHPSFIEPYQGAATGVGGILRDIFTMGARPIMSLDSLRFGDLDAPRLHAKHRPRVVTVQETASLPVHALLLLTVRVRIGFSFLLIKASSSSCTPRKDG